MLYISEAVQIAARLSARILIGERFCHDARWIEISSRLAVVTLKVNFALKVLSSAIADPALQFS